MSPLDHILNSALNMMLIPWPEWSEVKVCPLDKHAEFSLNLCSPRHRPFSPNPQRTLLARLSTHRQTHVSSPLSSKCLLSLCTHSNLFSEHERQEFLVSLFSLPQCPAVVWRHLTAHSPPPPPQCAFTLPASRVTYLNESTGAASHWMHHGLLHYSHPY